MREDFAAIAERASAETRRSDELRLNRVVGWCSLACGALTGLVLGLWSFGGPIPVPAWLGPYDDLSRRLARLGHIAFFGLGILNLLLARELPTFRPGAGLRRAAARAMNFGNIFLPLSLFATAAYHPLRYVMSLPALAVTTALVLAAVAAWRAPRG